MIKIIFTILILALAFHGKINSIILADFSQDYQGFLQTYEAYRSAYNRYLTTRNRYLQYGTLTSQNEALVAVKDFINWRDEILQSYISLVRGKNTDTTYASLLDAESQFLATHKTGVSAVSSINDAVTLSQQVESRNLSFQGTSKKVIATLLIQKVEYLLLSYQLLNQEAEGLIQKLKASGHDVSTLERWLLDAKNKQLLTEQKLLEARNKTSTLQTGSLEQLSQAFTSIQFTVFEAHQYLKEAHAYLVELAEQIKYGAF